MFSAHERVPSKLTLQEGWLPPTKRAKFRRGHPLRGRQTGWGMIKPAIFQKHGASINRSIQRAINLVRRSTAINTLATARSVYLPLILISSQMNTEKWNMIIHFHVHQLRSSSKHVHVLAIQILSVRPSVCLSHAGIVSKRLNVLS